MDDQRLTVRERVRAADYLIWLASEANKAAAWLADQGLETEADKAELGAVHLLAAVALIERPLRPQPGPDRWKVG